MNLRVGSLFRFMTDSLTLYRKVSEDLVQDMSSGEISSVESSGFSRIDAVIVV